MATRLNTPIDADLGRVIEAAARDDDGAVAREHLAAGFPIYYCDAETPADMVMKKYPDGRRELIRFDLRGEHRIRTVD